MNFDNFKKVEKCYKQLSTGLYVPDKVKEAYKLLPQEYKVSRPSKNEKMAAIKVWFEKVFLEAIEKILPNGYSGQTKT